MNGSTSRQCHIALMGIDGAGKTSVASALSMSLRNKGHDVRIVSWKHAMNEASSPTASILAEISMLSYQFQYARAVAPDSSDLTALLTGDALRQSFPETVQRLKGTPIERNSPDLFLGSALLELAGSIFLHQTEIESKLRSGSIVIDESFGFKHVLKNILMAQRISQEGSPIHHAVENLRGTAQAVFGALLRPDHGYWIDTDPHLAWQWRAFGGATATAFEDYSIVGVTGKSSFVDLQTDCLGAFAIAVRQWQWQRISMLDRPRDENIHEAVTTIERDVLIGP